MRRSSLYVNALVAAALATRCEDERGEGEQREQQARAQIPHTGGYEPGARPDSLPGLYSFAMAFDEELADRIRLLAAADGAAVGEKRMFGGLAFLVRGNLAIAASGQGGLLVRVDPAESADLVRTTPATVAVMRGRELPGWLRVASPELADDEQLAPWVRRGVAYAGSLPPKR